RVASPPFPQGLLLKPTLAQHRRDLAGGEKPQQPIRLGGTARCRHASDRKYRRRLQFVWNGSHHLDATDLLQLADLLNGKIGLTGHELLSGKTLLDDHRPRVDLRGDAEDRK